MDVTVDEVAPGTYHARAKHVGWVLVVDGNEVTLVDSGYPGDRERVLASLEKIGRRPSDVAAILLTHGHPDHIGSAEYLRTSYNIVVATHELEVANVRGERIEQVGIPTLLRKMWRRDILVWSTDIALLRAAQVQRLQEVETFTDGALDVPGLPVAIHTPGHTSGHTAFHMPDRGVLIAGDALMTEHAVVSQRGPQLPPDFFNHDYAQARASLDRLAGLAADVVVPGHGPAFRGTPAEAVKAALAA